MSTIKLQSLRIVPRMKIILKIEIERLLSFVKVLNKDYQVLNLVKIERN